MSSKSLWPTPLTTNRKSRRAMLPHRLGGESSPPGLEQAVKLSLGMIIPELQSASAQNQLTLFAEDSPASLTLSPVAEVPPQTSGISGQNSAELFASLSPDGWLRRTSQGYSVPRLDDTLAPFSGTWPRSGMTVRGTAYRLQPLAPLTDEIGSGSWPNPTDKGNYNKKGLSAKSGDGLAMAVKHWPTPDAHMGTGGRVSKSFPTGKRPSGSKQSITLNDAVRWATPTARDYRSPGTPERLSRAQRESSRGQPLTEQAGGQLNPTWVEWLMGFPLGWTALEPSATRSSRKSRNGSREGSSKSTRRKV
jgi:hypothetical protein